MVSAGRGRAGMGQGCGTRSILLLPYFPFTGAGEGNGGTGGAGLTCFGSPGPPWGLALKTAQRCSGCGSGKSRLNSSAEITPENPSALTSPRDHEDSILQGKGGQGSSSVAILAHGVGAPSVGSEGDRRSSSFPRVSPLFLLAQMLCPVHRKARSMRGTTLTPTLWAPCTILHPFPKKPQLFVPAPVTPSSF